MDFIYEKIAGKGKLLVLAPDYSFQHENRSGSKIQSAEMSKRTRKELL